MTRALIMDGALLGESLSSADVPLLRLGSGETVFGRLVRLLALNGVTEYAVCSGAASAGLREAIANAAFSGLRFTFLPSAELRDHATQLRKFLAGDEDVILVADNLVLSVEAIELLLEDAAPQLCLCGGNSREPGEASTSMTVLGRDGLLSGVVTGAARGGRGFWPVLKLTGVAAMDWIEQILSAPTGTSAGIAALNRIASDAAIGLLPVAGQFITRAGSTNAPDDLIEQVRLSDLRRQRTVCGPRGYVRVTAELARLGVSRVFLVGDQAYERHEIAGFLAALNIEVTSFTEFSAVPTWPEVVAAVRVFQESGCDGVLSVGDAGAIDLGKLVKLVALAPPPLDPFDHEWAFSPTAHIAIPACGSYGSESTAEAVLQGHDGVRRIRQDSLLPDVVFLDPTLCAQDSEARRHAVVLGALSRSVSAVWSPAADDESRRYALLALDRILDTLFDFVKGQDAEAEQAMLVAANLAGKAASLTGSSIVDALSYPLAVTRGLERGEAAAAVLLPAWRKLAKRIGSEADIARAAQLRHACDLLTARLGATTVEQAILRTRRIIELLRSNGDGAVDPMVAEATADPPLSADDLALSPLPLSRSEVRLIWSQAVAAAAESSLERTDIEVLKQFAAFCRARKLSCHLFGQTLCDAVTIGRLSPWSGPLTVAMPRSSYNRLLQCRDQLPAELWLDEAGVNPERAKVSPRVVLAGGLRPEDPDLLPGVTIRVLEGANYGSSPSQLLRRSALLLLHRATLAAERGESKTTTGMTAVAGRLGANRLGRLRVRLTWKGRRRPGAYTYVDPGLTGEFARSQYLAVWFGKNGRQLLEGTSFRAPVQAGAVLTRLYGSGYRDARAIPTGAVPPVPLPPVQTKDEPTPTATRPLVSVIVPVYNVAEYLPDCLDSLCLQDTDGYEIIAVDDGSPDNSIDILRDYEKRFPHLLRVVQKPNGGLSDARNYGLQFARGEYVGFVDSDDLVMPGMIRLMRDKAAATDADIVVCKHAEYFAESKRVSVRWMSFINSYGHSVGERPELLIAAHPYAWNKIYRRRLFDDYDIRYPKGQAFEDSGTTFNLMLHANKIEYVDCALYYYRMDRADSITNTFNEKFYDIFKSFDSIREFYTRHGRYDEFREEISELMRRTAFARVNTLETCRDPAAVEAFLTAVYGYLDECEPGWAQNKYFVRQMSNPRYGNHPKYRAMHSRKLMLEYFERLWQNRGDDLGYVSEHSTMDLIRMLQQEGLEILLRIDRFCAERGLTYYLGEGTLLGAVRHQGFIPWDDDVDIVMPRVDYERFLEAMERNEDPELRLFHERTYPQYHLTFAKVLSTRPSGFTNINVTVPVEFQGPAVDVFPLDAAPQRRDLAAERRVRWLRDMLLFKVDFMSLNTRRQKYRTYLASKAHSFSYLQRAIQREYRRHQDDPKAGYLVNYASSYPVGREKVKAAAYGVPKRVPFEGHLLPVPSDWDTVLRTTYGRYMKLPPASARKPRHRPRWRDPNS